MMADGTSEREQVEADRSLEIYDALATAGQTARLERLLQLIEANPEQRLILPQRGGVRAVLDGIDLSPAALPPAEEPGARAWWNRDLAMTDLHRADLAGARLRGATLRDVDLRRADLREAALGQADLQGALLEEADLRQADLAGARLQHAQLGQANLEQTLLEEADLRESNLRFARLRGAVLEGADLAGADLWSADLAEADLSGANLQGTVLQEIQMAGANMARTDLRAARLIKADLAGADLRGADLRDAELVGTNLNRAKLKAARLQDLDLTTCDIRHVHMAGARLRDTLFDREQLGEAIGEELAGEYWEASRGYLVLESNFQAIGDPDAASWAYRKKRRMQKLHARQRGGEALRQRHWRAALGHYVKFLSDRLVEWLCDYGESIPRVLRALFVVYVLFTIFYGVSGSVTKLEETPSGPVRMVTRDLDDLATFSLLAMSTSGSPVVNLLPRNELVHLATATEALVGIALTGLLGYVIGHRIRR